MDEALKTLGVPPFVLADIGARGEIPEPWSSLGEGLIVVGFEPDEEECARLNVDGMPSRRFLPVALWSHQTTIAVHLADFRGCSSVRAPNTELLAQYATQHATPRATEQRVSVPAVTLDGVVASERLNIDFLKIDTQGSEYEILTGASQTLESQVIGAVVETWTAEVHRNQHLSGEIMTLMHNAGFELFDVGIAAAWQRRIVDTTPLRGKSQVIGLDLLFFKNPLLIQDPAGSDKAAKLAAAAAMYGYPDFALEVLGNRFDPLRRAVLAASKPTRMGLPGRAKVLAQSLRARRREFPSLHD